MKDQLLNALIELLCAQVLNDEECGDGFRLSDDSGHDCREFEMMRTAQRLLARWRLLCAEEQVKDLY